nr:alpha-1D adrenergic receptor-like [Penaeus vannamei]
MLIIIATWLYVSVLWFPAFIYDRVLHHYDDGVCYWDPVLNKNLVVYVGMLGYYLPLLVMVGAYMKILHVVKKRAASIRDAGKKEVPTTSQPVESDSATGEAGGAGGGAGGSSDQKKLVSGAAKDDKQEAKLKREMKAVYTLLNIVIIFLICWVPFYILFVPIKRDTFSFQLSAWFPTLFPEWYLTFSYWMAYINSALNPILYPLSSLEFRAAYKKVFYTVFCGK